MNESVSFPDNSKLKNLKRLLHTRVIYLCICMCIYVAIYTVWSQYIISNHVFVSQDAFTNETCSNRLLLVYCKFAGFNVRMIDFELLSMPFYYFKRDVLAMVNVQFF